MAIEDGRRIRKEDLLRVVNGIFQMAPDTIFKGRITLIPKVNSPQQHGDFRPIIVLPVVVRLLHRVLVKRLREVRMQSTKRGSIRGGGLLRTFYY